MAVLDNINSPEDIKTLSLEQLEELVNEIREKIIATVLNNGGHLASPLGVVELTIALHYVFDIGKDVLIWDVGHQAYTHKILTGRNHNFETLRQKEGISGYPRLEESPLDFFGTGHSSTSISAALGMAIARDLRGEDYHVIAVIGDGAMTGGMAMEALSHAGNLEKNLLVILNDNEMSIARNTGALARYFNRLIMAYPYKRAKEDVGSFVKKIVGKRVTRTIHDLEKSVKGFITKGMLFQELGFNYIGPVDGHDLPLLIECFKNLKYFTGPVLFHCRTEKGKGFKEAEEDPQKYHGVKPKKIFKSDEEGDGVPLIQPVEGPTKSFTEHFGEAICRLAETDNRIIAITAAMPAGTGLTEFAQKFPDRFFDVGICEQHAVTLAAGLAARGFRPVVAIYSTFIQRAYDQVIHDVCLQNLPVTFAIDRAGLVGEDGATHIGTFDLSFLRLIPNLKLCSPRDGYDLEKLLEIAILQGKPIAIRYPKAQAIPTGPIKDRNYMGADILLSGTDGYFIATGSEVNNCIQVAKCLQNMGISIGVLDIRWVKPLDTRTLNSLSTSRLFIVEENTLIGGLGSAILEYFNDNLSTEDIKIYRLGVPDIFCQHASREEQLKMVGLSVDALTQKVIDTFEQTHQISRNITNLSHF
ncbi:MAG TPA: 1-deoxy-D-xylulose-5-phosphate synthase [Candidatus Hydrogenedens sp.]|nr:1-deoxy-D-xylulose-5-phosphate synthase [Candidatus Hydrogenedens sp.]